MLRKILTISKQFHDVIWLSLEKFLFLGISLFVTLKIANHLQPELFGRLSYLLALMHLIQPFMALGLNSIITKALVQRQNDEDIILGSAIAARSVAGILIAPLVACLGYYFLAAEHRLLFIFLVFCSVFNSALVIDFWVHAKGLNRNAVQIRSVVLILFSSARLLAVYIDSDLKVFVILVGLEIVFLAASYILLYQRLTRKVGSLSISWHESKRLLSDSRWLLLSGIAAVIYLKIDQVMIGGMLDEEAVGIYAIAARFSEIWYFIPLAIVTSFFPQLILKQEIDEEDFLGDLQRLNDFLFLIALALALVITWSADRFIPFFFGDTYREAIPVLLVHIWAAILVFMRALLSKWLIVKNLLRLSLLSQVCGALVNVCANFYLIPIYGLTGAAYATVLGYLVAGFGILFFHKDLQPMAFIVGRSFMLPYRLAKYGRSLYGDKS